MKYLHKFIGFLFVILLISWKSREGYPKNSSYTFSKKDKNIPKPIANYIRTYKPYIMYTKNKVVKTLDKMFYGGLTPSLVLSIPKKHPKESQILDALNKGLSLGETPLENVPYVYSKERQKYVPYVTSTPLKTTKPKPIRQPEVDDPGAPFF
jgi:hypothetical protein